MLNNYDLLNFLLYNILNIVVCQVKKYDILFDAIYLVKNISPFTVYLYNAKP